MINSSILFFLSPSSPTGTSAVGNKPLYTTIRLDLQSWPSIPFSCVGKMRKKLRVQKHRVGTFQRFPSCQELSTQAEAAVFLGIYPRHGPLEPYERGMKGLSRLRSLICTQLLLLWGNGTQPVLMDLFPSGPPEGRTRVDMRQRRGFAQLVGDPTMGLTAHRAAGV